LIVARARGRLQDLSGRLAVVTGANSGLGRIAAGALAGAGARVVLACRDKGRGEEAAQAIAKQAPNGHAEVERLDLADLASVREFAERLRDREDLLDLLVNNAGVMAIPRHTTRDGFEQQFGVNHLGHFALTGLVLPLLLGSRSARVVTVASNAHLRGQMRFDDLQSEHEYKRWRVYSQSKLANLLFAYEFDRRLKAAQSSLRSLAAHPGYAATNLQYAGPRMDGGLTGAGKMVLTFLANAIVAESVEAGAQPILYAATAELPGGSYVGPAGRRGFRGPPAVVASSPASRDQDAARRLWTISEELTGVAYEFPNAEASPAGGELGGKGEA
jgi:NAD(P)-dependent dehydrogenase (short-subunit alcohol dehydrogenase family)